MKTQDTEVGGCCFGIPFGCSSVLALIAGLGLWHQTGSTWFLAVGVAPSVLAAGAGALVAALRLTGRQPHSFLPAKWREQ